MPKIITLEFIYTDLLDIKHPLGKHLVDGEKYEMKYMETPAVTDPTQTGIYRMMDGFLVGGNGDNRIAISGNSYIEINRSTGETHRVDSVYCTSTGRYDSKGRDVVEIIKKSIVEWRKLK
jgi:hypothetical protein